MRGEDATHSKKTKYQMNQENPLNRGSDKCRHKLYRWSACDARDDAM